MLLECLLLRRLACTRLSVMFWLIVNAVGLRGEVVVRCVDVTRAKGKGGGDVR